MSTDLISVIIPIYNAEKYLKTCLESILEQTHKNLEIICINDGSTDGSLQILTEYALKDSRIKSINQKNHGASASRNVGLDNATGDYIMFVDADDYIEKNTCELAVQTAKQHDTDLVFWSYVREYENDSKEKHFLWNDGEIFENEIVKTSLLRKLCGPFEEELAHPEHLHSFESLCPKLYRASIISNNHIRFTNIKEMTTSEDGYFNLNFLWYVKKAIYIKKGLYHYNKTNETSVTTVYKKNLFSQRQILDSLIYDFIKQHNLSQDFYDALNNRKALNLIDLSLNIVSSEFKPNKKINLIAEILNHPQYKNAYKQLPYKYFPLHWKVFFICAKLHLSLFIYILSVCIKTLIHKK